MAFYALAGITVLAAVLCTLLLESRPQLADEAEPPADLPVLEAAASPKSSEPGRGRAPDAPPSWEYK